MQAIRKSIKTRNRLDLCTWKLSGSFYFIWRVGGGGREKERNFRNCIIQNALLNLMKGGREVGWGRLGRLVIASVASVPNSFLPVSIHVSVSIIIKMMTMRMRVISMCLFILSRTLLWR